LPIPTGTTKSKLCADKVLKIRSKLQSGLGAVQVPAPAAPVGLLHVYPVAQSAVVVQLPAATNVHAESCENS
jgi:hypothetical protein